MSPSHHWFSRWSNVAVTRRVKTTPMKVVLRARPPVRADPARAGQAAAALGRAPKAAAQARAAAQATGEAAGAALEPQARQGQVGARRGRRPVRLVTRERSEARRAPPAA